IAAHLRDRFRSVRNVRRVADVDDLFRRQLVEHHPRHREPTDPRVEDPDGRVRHYARLRTRSAPRTRRPLRCSPAGGSVTLLASALAPPLPTHEGAPLRSTWARSGAYAGRQEF